MSWGPGLHSMGIASAAAGNPGVSPEELCGDVTAAHRHAVYQATSTLAVFSGKWVRLHWGPRKAGVRALDGVPVVMM